MRTRKEVIALVGSLHKNMTADKGKFLDLKAKEIMVNLNVGTPDEVHNKICTLVETIKASVGGASYGLDIDTPKYRVSCSTSSVSTTDDTVQDITLTFRNKLNSDIEYSRVYQFSAKSEILVSEMYDAFIAVLNELAYIEQTQKIVEDVNSFLSELKAENDLAVDIEFRYVDSEEIVLSVTDTSIVFGVSVDGALSVAEMGMFQSGDNFSDLCRQHDIDKYISDMKTIQFAPQVIKANIDIVTKMLGSRIMRRADKILRRTYHKKAEFLAKQNKGIGYYCETIGKDDNEKIVFSLVEKADDTYSVILSPFNVKTLERVDKIDVLKKVGLK